MSRLGQRGAVPAGYALWLLAVVVAVAGVYMLGVVQGWYGQPERAGVISTIPISPAVIDARASRQLAASPAESRQQILFGDLHVHTTYYNDAFRMSLPLVQGEGAHPPADACDYARYCSALDFWSITDHAEGLTPWLWQAVAPLIEDAWQVFECKPDQRGCRVEFEDPHYTETARDTVYYVRAVQESGDRINAGNLRCEIDASGACVAVNPCYGDFRTDRQDNCLSEAESKAWSSPIFVDFPKRS